MSDRDRTILFIEDDGSLRSLVTRYLRTHGFDVVEADSSEAAADAIAAGLRPGLMLLDLNLPGDTGWDLLRGHAIVAAGSPPVVVTSATTVSPRRLAEFECAGYLPKPYPLDTLVATIERLMQPSEARPTEGSKPG